MKHFKLIILLTILPLSALADGDHKTIELTDFTKNSMNRTTAAVTTDANGTINLDTSNSYRSTTFVRINEDGKKETLCTTSEAEAVDFMTGKSIKPQNEGE